MTDNSTAENITKVRHRIRIAAQIIGRQAQDITLLAVSKTRPAQALRRAWEAGVEQFGENYLREALDKMRLLQDLPLCWHFIGPVQSNKTRAIAEHFTWIHSVDRLKIARRLSEQRPLTLPPLQVCLQVNISAEASKSGVSLEQLPELAAAVSMLPNLNLRGLMAIPAAEPDRARQRQAFAAIRLALEQLQQRHPELDTLSMGMSEDLEAAIAEGATIVRIGTDIFGPRDR
ncbi:MAG: YggS family pyridoxal phosphate-dependent enzyme [Gammaproteobacteria bacterium]|nr:YggS family pyridoxal phosphate-dependent enzyme [Gammaproteobacteria bacterium]